MLTRLRAHLAGRGQSWWVPVFYALVVAWTYRDLWHQHGAATGLGWDTIDTHGPDLDFLARELREGRFSLWDPYDKGGYAVYADPVVCRYYPLAWLFAGWGAVFGTSWWLVQIMVLAHHVAIGACMHLYLRSRGLAASAAMVGGVGLVVSAPLLIHKASNILWPLAWVPLVWVAIDAAVARPSWQRGMAVAAAFALCLTAGSPPGLFYAGLLIAPYGVWRVVSGRPPWRQLAVCALAAAVVTGLVLAVVVIPAQALAALGSRDRWAQGDAFALSLSFPLGGVLRDVYAHGTGWPEMYVGAAIVLLAVCAVAAPGPGRKLAVVFLAIAIAGYLLVAGATTPVLPWLVHHVPGFGSLRIPGRYKMLATWSLAAAAGHGAAALGELRGRRLLVLVGVAIAVSAVTVIATGSSKLRPAWWSIAAMALPGALAVVAAQRPRLRWAASGALVLVVLTDAPLFIHRPDALPAAERRQVHARDEQLLGRLTGVRDTFRLYDEFVLGERVGQRRAVRDFRGYPAVDPLSYRRYLDVLDFAKREPAIITDFNVRWVLQAPHFRYGTSSSFLPLLQAPAFVARGDQIFEASHPAPLVAWYGAATVVSDPKQVLAAVRAAQTTTGERDRAVLEPAALAQVPALAQLAEAPPGAVAGALVSYEPDEIVVAVDAPRDGIVVLNELAFAGWTVEVDGAPAVPVAANYVLRAVHVGPGHHAIRWRFAPPARWLIAGYLAALAIMLAALASAGWHRRRATAQSQARSSAPR